MPIIQLFTKVFFIFIVPLVLMTVMVLPGGSTMKAGGWALGVMRSRKCSPSRISATRKDYVLLVLKWYRTLHYVYTWMIIYCSSSSAYSFLDANLDVHCPTTHYNQQLSMDYDSSLWNWYPNNTL